MSLAPTGEGGAIWLSRRSYGREKNGVDFGSRHTRIMDGAPMADVFTLLRDLDASPLIFDTVSGLLAVVGAALSVTVLSRRLTPYKSLSIWASSHTAFGKSDSKDQMLGASPSGVFCTIFSYCSCRFLLIMRRSRSVSGMRFLLYFLRTRLRLFSLSSSLSLFLLVILSLVSAYVSGTDTIRKQVDDGNADDDDSGFRRPVGVDEDRRLSASQVCC